MYIIWVWKNIIWDSIFVYLALGQDLPFFLYCAMYPLPWVPIPCKWIITIMCEQVWYHLQFALSMLPFSVWNLQFATGCSLSEGGALWVWRMEPGSIHWDNNVWHICVYCTLYDIFVKGPSIETSVHYALYLVPCAVNIVHCALCSMPCSAQCGGWRQGPSIETTRATQRARHVCCSEPSLNPDPLKFTVVYIYDIYKYPSTNIQTQTQIQTYKQKYTNTDIFAAQTPLNPDQCNTPLFQCNCNNRRSENWWNASCILWIWNLKSCGYKKTEDSKAAHSALKQHWE